jgi:hypothetical protein
MTASPPWAPQDAPASPLYPMTDDDVLGEPVPVERFAPPPQAARPSLFERLRDRLAVRRALARSSSAYEDQVQIVSGLGAPLRPGRARLEVERRRQEALRMDPGAIPGEEPAHHRPDEADDGVDAELGLGPLPPLPPEQSPMPRPAPRPTLPGQMALSGTSVGDPRRAAPPDESLPPVHRVPMPPPGHTIGSVPGELPPPRPPMPPVVPPPPPPIPDPLSEVLSGFDREPGSSPTHEPRPWRPREVAEDHLAAPAPPRPVVPGRPETAERHRAGLVAQQREGRRLLALFGAAALLMFVVGIVSGRTTSPLPSSSTTGSSGAAAPATAKPQAQASKPAAKASTAPAPVVIGPPPNTQPTQAPVTSTPQLTSVKVLGDGGTGYQVKGFRYGIHPNDFRIVLDMTASGAASGTPKATIGFLDPTTMLVVLDGVVPAGSTGELPSSDPVTAVTLMQQSPFPGSTVYQVKLAHPVQFTAGYMASPLRLVLDLSS